MSETRHQGGKSSHSNPSRHANLPFRALPIKHIKISNNDLGAGYSPMAYIQKRLVAIVMLDTSFVMI